MYLSSADEEFWGKGPAWSADTRELGALVGIGIRHFVMADNDDLPADLASGPPVAGMMHLPPGAYIPSVTAMAVTGSKSWCRGPTRWTAG